MVRAIAVTYCAHVQTARTLLAPMLTLLQVPVVTEPGFGLRVHAHTIQGQQDLWNSGKVAVPSFVFPLATAFGALLGGPFPLLVGSFGCVGRGTAADGIRTGLKKSEEFCTLETFGKGQVARPASISQANAVSCILTHQQKELLIRLLHLTQGDLGVSRRRGSESRFSTRLS